MSIVLVAFETAPKVDPELKAKDELLEENLTKLAKGDFHPLCRYLNYHFKGSAFTFCINKHLIFALMSAQAQKGNCL